MPSVDEVKQATAENLGVSAEEDFEYITEALIEEYEGAFADNDTEGVAVVREDGLPASDADIRVEEPPDAGEGAADTTETGETDVVPAAATATYYGNHPAWIGNCLYWKTNGVGGPCGTAYRGRVCYRRASWQWITNCAAGYRGYRITIY